MLRRWVWCAVLVVGTLCACGSPDAHEGVRTETLENGAIHVLNPPEGTWGPDEPWEPELQLEIGAVDGDGPDVFGQPTGVAVDAQGRIHVLDGLAQELRSFDTSGVPVSVVGRSGDGPGEFQFPLGLVMGPRGTLWVWDPMASRYSEFDPSSGFLRSVQRTSNSMSLAWRGRFHPDGRMIDWEVSMGPGDGALYPLAINLSDGSTEVFPPLVRRAPGDPIPSVVFGLDQRGSVWMAPGGVYPLYRRSLQGDTLMVISVASPEEPEQQDVYVAHILDDGAGHLLVLLEDREERRDTSVDVFREADGVYLGRILLPVRIERSQAAASERAIIGVIQRDLGVPAVVRVSFR